MYRVCVGYVSRMYRVCIGIFGKVTTFFSYANIRQEIAQKKSPLMQNINGDAAEPLVLEFSEFQRCALVSG